jgi:hypothetical protein
MRLRVANSPASSDSVVKRMGLGCLNRPFPGVDSIQLKLGQRILHLSRLPTLL